MHNLFTDGGSRGNPGPAGFGAILFDEDFNLVDLTAKYLGEVTNNQAEYMGLIDGLKMAGKNKISEVRCFLDSELAVKQLNGEYKVKNGNIKPLFDNVKKEIEKFDKVIFQHVVREKNKFADKLANVAMDAGSK